MKKQFIEADEHAGALMIERKSAELHKLTSIFLKLDPIAEGFFKGLKEKRLSPLGDLRAIIALVEFHGREEVVTVLKDAAKMKAYGSQYLENILEQRQRYNQRPRTWSSACRPQIRPAQSTRQRAGYGYIQQKRRLLMLQLKDLDRTDFLEELIQAESDDKRQRLIQRRIKNARLGTIKLIDDNKFSHPSKIDEQKVRFHARLGFMEKAVNVIFIGNVGLGKTHLAKSYCDHACLAGKVVLMVTAVEIVNHLSAALKEN